MGTIFVKQESNFCSDSNYKIYNCESSTSIGDNVYMNPTISDKVEVATDNRNDNPIVGIVIEKLSSSVAKVLLSGECPLVFSGLDKSKPVFLSATGTLNNSAPATGFIQKMGMCLEDNKIFLNIDYMRVKRTPF